MIRRFLPCLLSLLILATACSIPTDDEVALIDEEQLHESLQRVTTTTTSTTQPGEALQSRVFFLLSEVAESEQRQVKQVPLEVTASADSDFIARMFSQDFALLANENSDEELINQLVRYEFVRVEIEEDRQIATVFLRDDSENGDPILRDAAAQLVWTLTSLEDVDRVSININDSLVNLPTTNEDTGTLAAVQTSDYAAYDREVVTPTTTTSAEPATTTVPPEDG